MWTSVCTAKGQEGTRCQGQQYLPARWGWTRDRGKRGTSFFILCISVMSDFLYQTRSNFLKFNRKGRWLRFFRAGRGPQANPEPQGGQDRPAGPGRVPLQRVPGEREAQRPRPRPLQTDAGRRLHSRFFLGPSAEGLGCVSTPRGAAAPLPCPRSQPSCKQVSFDSLSAFDFSISSSRAPQLYHVLRT